MFASLPAASPRRWTYRGYAVLGQTVALVLLIELGLLTPRIIEHHEKPLVISLSVPVPIPHNLQKIPPALIRPPREVLQQPPKLAELQPVAPPKIDAPKVEPPRIEAKIMPPKPMVSVKPVFESATTPKTDPKPGPAVKTGDFNSIGSSATPTTTLEASRVQTGGFGDPNGVAAEKTSNAPPNIARVGSFDMPSGPGSGNGTGGARGAKGVVASAGFGNGAAAPGGGGHGHGGEVRSTAFDSAAPAPGPRHAAASAPPTSSAEVLSKPTPVYTSEARALKLQGEVLLQVVFRANGQVEVVRVVRGLGHGLDQAAIQAAEKIKFKPAMRDGNPVDSTATLHIVFQLA